MASGNFSTFLQSLITMGQPAASPTTAVAAPGSFEAALQQYQQLAASGGTPATASTKTAPAPSLVWMGQRVTNKPNPNFADSSAYQDAMKNGGRVGVTPDAVVNLPYTWSDKQREAAYKRVSESVGQPIQSFQQFNSIWANAIKVAEQSWVATNGGKTGSPMTVWDVFDLSKREGSKYGFAGGGSGGSGGTTVSTSSSVEKLSDGTMWQILKSTATQALGRAPTTDELQRFASRANQVASENPTTTTTTTTSGAGGSSSRSSTQQGASAGDYQLAAENQLNADPEAGAYQASTVYADALFRGIQSPV